MIFVLEDMINSFPIVYRRIPVVRNEGSSLINSTTPINNEPRETKIPKTTISLKSNENNGFSIWRANLSSIYDVSLPIGADADVFAVEGKSYQLPDAVVSTVSSVAQILNRSQIKIQSDPFPFVEVFFVLRGHVRTVGEGRTCDMFPGDIGVFDYGRPFKSCAGEFSSIGLTVHREKVPSLLRTGNLHCRVLSNALPIARLLTQHAQSLVGLLDDLSITEADKALKALLALAVDAFGADADNAAVISRDDLAASLLLDRAIRYIDDHLGSPDLLPGLIADELSLQRNTLFRLFEAFGGVESFITGRRLDRCLVALLDLPVASRTISRVAYRHGFKSDAHFSRAFRKRFSRSPRDVVGMGRTQNLEWLESFARQAGFNNRATWLHYLRESEHAVPASVEV